MITPMMSDIRAILMFRALLRTSIAVIVLFIAIVVLLRVKDWDDDS